MSAMEKKAHYEDEEEEKEKGKNIMEVEVKKEERSHYVEEGRRKR